MALYVKDKSRKKYSYVAFGIQIESDIMLPELHKGAERTTDARIYYGEVPNELSSPVEKDNYYQVAEDEFLLRLEGIANYYVINGEQIVVQPCEQADLREVRLFLLGTVMGVLLMQRGIVPIHGSAVVVDGHCLVFTGVSGAGKSTVAAALHKKGYDILTDDVSAVTFDKEGVPWVQSGYPQQKLWQTSASMIGIDTTPLERITKDEDKYAVPIPKGFWRGPMPLAAVYEIMEKPCNDITIIPLTGIEKITTIMNNIYRSGLFNGLGLKKSHFQKCANVVNHIQVFRLTRPENIPSLDRQIDVLEQQFAELFMKNEKDVNKIG